MKFLCALLSVFLLCSLGFARSVKQPSPIFTGIGQTHFDVHANNPLAQQYFDQGLAFFYGFDYAESIRSFESSTQMDSRCALCFWGLALALGSKANAVMNHHEMAQAHFALDQAKALAQATDKRAQALIQALMRRYDGVKDNSEGIADIELPYKNSLAFSNAMYRIAKQYPKDDNLQTLFAFSVFNVVEWDFWSLYGTPKPYTLMALARLKLALKTNPDNIGAIHYFIHATEWSPTPQRDLHFANKLPTLAPTLEHLVHMPTHTYLRLGDYDQAVRVNRQAVNAYQEYAKQCREQGFKPLVTFLNHHNYDFLFASAIMLGDKDTALETARRVRDEIEPGWLEKYPFQQRFYALRYVAWAHFGLWDAALKAPKPEAKNSYLTMMWWYVRTLALVHTGEHKAARQADQALTAIAKHIRKSAKNKQFKMHAQLVMKIVQANLAASTKHWDQAILYWQQACNIQDARFIGDPPQWFFPCYEGLGFALLDANRVQQALAAFNADLALYPKNPWSLYGKVQALKRLGLSGPLSVAEADYEQVRQHSPLKLPFSQGSDMIF